MSDRAVYVVDDDPLALKDLAATLREETEFQVAAFSSMGDLQAAIARRAPDAVIVHAHPRDSDMLGLLRALRAESPGIVVIAMAPFGDGAARHALMEALGPLAVIDKPCELRELVLTLRAGLDRRDLSLELAEARAELARARTSLDATTREARTATERLVEAEQLAAVGRVVSGIANELTHQLALIGYAEAIKARVAGDHELTEFADVIVTAQRRLAQMVDEIRDFAATDAEHSRLLAREPSDVAGVVEEALSIMRYDRGVRARVIEREVRARPLAAIDRKKFSQVVINLVSNAALATDPGDTIVVRLEADTGAGEAVVSVIDRGCGMTPEVLARLGEPFFSARRERGSGLGVGICRRIVEDHGGTLTFRSAVANGTTATVRVPLLEDIV